MDRFVPRSKVGPKTQITSNRAIFPSHRSTIAHPLLITMCESAFRSVHGVPRAARILDAADLGFDYVAQPPGERGLRLHVHPQAVDMETTPVCPTQPQGVDQAADDQSISISQMIVLVF